MNPYIRSLNDWLAQQQPDYGYPGAHTLLQHLWCSYTECNPIENEKTDTLFSAMDPIFESLPIRASSFLFDKICALLGEYGQSAFLSGIQVGMRLNEELAVESAQQ